MDNASPSAPQLPVKKQKARRIKFRYVLLFLYICLWLVLGAFPWKGPPQFRYTGMHEDRIVWNFGWPLAMYTYDR